MKITLRALIAAGICWTYFCHPAHANEAIIDSNNEIGISAGNENFQYHEHNEFPPGESVRDVNPPHWLDSNVGNMPAINLHLSRQGPLFGISDVFTSIDLTYAKGNTTYVGNSVQYEWLSYHGPDISRVYSPLRFNSPGWTADAAVKVGKGIPLGSRWQLTPYLTAGAHVWNRDSNYPHNYYSHGQAGIGFMLQYSPISRLVLGLDASAQEAFSSKVSENGEVYDLGSKPILTGKISADYAMTRHWHVTASYTVSQFRYGHSQVINGVWEPSDVTTTQTVMGGLAYSF